jgi:hypothetical protein
MKRDRTKIPKPAAGTPARVEPRRTKPDDVSVFLDSTARHLLARIEWHDD